MKEKCKMNFKRISVFLTLVLLAGNVFAYNYVKKFYDWRGDNVYKVVATNTAFINKTEHLVQINSLNNGISYNFILKNEREVMNLYQTLSRMNTATLEEVIRSVKWEFWFRGDNGFIFYYSAGLF